jgi:hypothetical protein
MSSKKSEIYQYFYGVRPGNLIFSGGSYGTEWCNGLMLKGFYGREEFISETPVYPLEVSKILVEWDEMDKRDRRILEVGAAIQLIKKEQKGILRKFQKIINLS